MNFAHSEVAALDQNTMRTLCEEYLANNYIDPETSERLGVKRGLRNPDGTGVLAGLTNVCDVVGYKKDQEGHVIPTPGKLIYRGVNINEIVDEAYRILFCSRNRVKCSCCVSRTIWKTMEKWR